MAADEKNDVLNAVQSSSSASLDIVRRRRQSVPAEPTLQGSIKPRLQLQKIQPAPDTTLLCRYELKYRIPETKARAIAQYVSAFIHPDRYAKNKPGNEYLISSLYLDTPTLTLCNETLQGKKNRFKLRIRGYDDNPLSPVFLEIKRRACNVIVKSRVGVEKAALGNILAGRFIPPLTYTKDRDAFNQFMMYAAALSARPIVLVRYLRQAFEGDSDNRVRITFDRQLCFKTTCQPVVSVNGTGWTSVAMDFVVLEIKFTSRYPLWLSEMVKIFDLKQSSMSKYVSSVQQSCQLGYCSPPAGSIWCYDE